jgi:predicted permease
VLLVLLIACSNVANLLFAAALARRRELAIRVALGAGPSRIARQLATEGALLALAGGAIGVVLAMWLLQLFTTLAGRDLPRAGAIAIDGRVLAFTAAVSLAVGVLCGLWPMLLLRAKELAIAIREGDTRTGSAAGGRLLGAVVVTEIALGFVLLFGAGLLVKNLRMLHARDAGVRTENVLAFDTSPAGPRYEDPERGLALYRELLARLDQLPQVEAVGMTSHLPMRDWGWNGEFELEGGTPWNASDAPLVEYRWIYGDYFQTLGVPLLKGRMLGPDDRRGSNVVLINQAMADKFWPGKDPLGKRFGQGTDPADWYEVVGVVGNTRSRGLAQPAPYEFYRTIEQNPLATLTTVVRTRGSNPTALVPTARQIVASIDPDLPLSGIATLEAVAADSVGQARLMSALDVLFGVLAGALAIVGVYGVMTYSVRCQRREFGVRLALGADEAHVRGLVRGRGLRLALQGVLIGAVGAFLLRGVLRAVLDDVKPTDLGVFAATAAVLFAASWLASYLPARWASRLDPIVVLRDQAQ